MYYFSNNLLVVSALSDLQIDTANLATVVTPRNPGITLFAASVQEDFEQ
jgi:hypothetical protein